MQNRRIVNGIFREAGAEPRPTVETNSISTLYGHVRDGPLVGRDRDAPGCTSSTCRDGMRAIPLVEPDDDRSIGLVWLDRDPEPLLARALLEIARRAWTSSGRPQAVIRSGRE